MWPCSPSLLRYRRQATSQAKPFGVLVTQLSSAHPSIQVTLPQRRRTRYTAWALCILMGGENRTQVLSAAAARSLLWFKSPLAALPCVVGGVGAAGSNRQIGAQQAQENALQTYHTNLTQTAIMTITATLMSSKHPATWQRPIETTLFSRNCI